VHDVWLDLLERDAERVDARSQVPRHDESSMRVSYRTGTFLFGRSVRVEAQMPDGSGHASCRGQKAMIMGSVRLGDVGDS
jgi:hypothetical protein